MKRKESDSKIKGATDARAVVKAAAESHGWYTRYAAHIKGKTGRTLPFAGDRVELIAIEKKFAILGDAIRQDNQETIRKMQKELVQKMGMKDPEFQSLIKTFREDIASAASKASGKITGTIKSALVGKAKEKEEPKDFRISDPVNPHKLDVTSRFAEYKRMPVAPSRVDMSERQHDAAKMAQLVAKAATPPMVAGNKKPAEDKFITPQKSSQAAPGRVPPPVPQRDKPRTPPPVPQRDKPRTPPPPPKRGNKS